MQFPRKRESLFDQAAVCRSCASKSFESTQKKQDIKEGTQIIKWLREYTVIYLVVDNKE